MPTVLRMGLLSSPWAASMLWPRGAAWGSPSKSLQRSFLRLVQGCVSHLDVLSIHDEAVYSLWAYLIGSVMEDTFCIFRFFRHH